MRNFKEIWNKALQTWFFPFMITVMLFYFVFNLTANSSKNFEFKPLFIGFIALIGVLVFLLSITNFLSKDKETYRTISDKINEILLKKVDFEYIIKLVHETSFSTLEERFREDLKTNAKEETIINTLFIELNIIRNNIKKYIFKLERNSIVNLIIGIATTFTAISVLGYALYI